jgi:4-aminobutyrate aminotransferase-like enzyme
MDSTGPSLPADQFVLHSLRRDRGLPGLAVATEVCAEAWRFAVERGLLCQFGGIGGNVLKFKPPLTTPEKDFERMLDLVEEVTAFIEDRVHRRVATPA